MGWIRRRKAARDAATSLPSEDLPAKLDALRELRLKGDHAGFIELCNTLARNAGLQSEAYITSDLANAVQYGGHRIPDIDLDQIERKLREDLNVSD